MSHIVEYKPKLRRKRNKSTLRAETQKTIHSLIITLTVMIAVLGITLLAATNSGSQRGYTLKQLDLKNRDLMSINEGLKTKITNTTSFREIEGQDIIDTMSEPESKDYITKEDNEVH